MTMTLHGYFRSTASWRVRIALALKGLEHDDRFHDLRTGAQRDDAYLAINPQGFVPALTLDDGQVLTQSLAICEYLEEIAPRPPLLPAGAVERAQVRAFAQVIACDIHPVQNLKVLKRLRALGLEEPAVTAWARETIEDGLDACATLIAGRAETPFLFGDAPGLADLFLAPQLSNARRFGADLRWPRLLEVEARCLELPAFATTAPMNQPDAS